MGGRSWRLADVTDAALARVVQGASRRIGCAEVFEEPSGRTDYVPIGIAAE
jgi:hypothetical protein